jgi:DNA repair exonuclease SbcCD ATPase subunit
MLNQDAAARDYQKVLEQQILKLNYKTFTQVVILGSASFVPFMQLPSNQRREVIEDILDIKIFSTMNSLLKEKANETKQQIAQIESDIKIARGKVDSQTTIIKNLTEAKSESIGRLVDTLASNELSIIESQNHINTISVEIQTLKDATISKTTIDNEIEQAKNIRSKLNARLEHCETHSEFFTENDVCPSCSQGIGEDYKHKVIEELNAKIEETNTQTDELDKILTNLNEQLSEINRVLGLITDKNIELSTHNSTVTLLNKQNIKLQAEIESSKADTTNVDEEKRKLKELAQDALQMINEKTALAEHRNLEEVASILLKDTGIKTAIIREYLPVMNKLINKYLNAMDTYIHFELDEAFNEKIRSRFRDEFTYASFSEGEKMRIDLAILFTWRQVAKMKNSVNTNLLLLDEIFDSSLDTSGTDYFLNLMNQFGDKANIFVISHKGDQLFDKFRSVIKFEKRNDFSIIA